tara:strand:+ start:460 stop:1464 length:1005 start_codon:yes stop_codon:yes gene_type:complete
MTTAVKKINTLVLDTFSTVPDAAELWNTDQVQKTLKTIVAASLDQDNRKKKDPNAPKRGKSGYLFFCSEYRHKVKDEMGPDSKATDVTRELGVRWNALKTSGKKADEKLITGFNKMAENDKARYAEQKAVYVPPADFHEPKRRGGKRETNGPKRAKSAYLFFCTEYRPVVKDDLGENAKVTDITRELGSRWNALKSDSSRAVELAKYTDAANGDKQRYEDEKSTDGKQTKAPAKNKASDNAKTKDKTIKKAKTDVVDDDDIVEEEAVTKKPATKKSEGTANGYQAFCAAKRASIKEQYPKAKAHEITKKLSTAWKALSNKEQDVWKQGASCASA